MIQAVRTALSTVVVAARRLWATRWLALAGAVGLLSVVALTLSIPLYADSVYFRILKTELTATENGMRPPFAFMFRYIGSWHGLRELGDVTAVDDFMINQVPAYIGLDREVLVRFFQTDTFQLFPQADAGFFNSRQPLTWASLGYVSDFRDHVHIIEGELPRDSTTIGDPVDVVISLSLAEKLGLQVGEQYIAFFRKGGSQKTADKQIPLRIAGIWVAKDPADRYWFYRPDYLKEVMLTTGNTYAHYLSPYLDGEVYLALWYMVFNGDRVRSEHVQELLSRINLTMTRANSLMPDVRLDESPVRALWNYEQANRLLTIQLFAFSAPILGLALAFITLVAGLTVGGQRNEIAVLRSRGASIGQVVVISLIEALALAGLALAVGAFAGQGLAQLVGQTRSFLNFAGGESLSVALTGTSLRFGAAIALLAVLVTVMPVIGAARHTIISYKLERARALRPPLWQRMFLDVLLFIPAAYGTYLLNQQGSIVVPGVVSVGGGDPFSNPLLFLVPSLMMLSLGLFLIRLFPFFLRLLSWLLSRLPGAAVLLAIRQLSRSPGFYSAPMLLLVLTLALATYTASLAATLDQHLIDRVRYQVGGDMRLIEQPQSTSAPGSSLFGGAAAAAAASSQEEAGPRWLFLPVNEHLKVEGVQEAARIGLFAATARTATGQVQGRFLGIDRLEYGRVAFWRSDFASQPLGALLNNLGLASNGVLLPESVLTENALQIGDPIRVIVPVFGASANMDMKIVGTFRRWPGWYPNKENEGPLFVGNLEYFFEQAGGQVPYDVWLKVRDGADPQKIVADARSLGFTIVGFSDVGTEVLKEQTRPERQGLFGVLSVGFAAAALLTVLGFFLYAVFSFRRRLIELGMLRAIGLSTAQMAAMLGWELLLLLGTGMLAGTALGVAASSVYVPFMQVGLAPEATVLPFRVLIAWPAIYNIYALFGLLFVLALLVLLAYLTRMKIFQAVKMGETI